MKTILYVTHLYYEAKGRSYFEEDLFITSRLKQHFAILIGHPHQVISYLDCADFLVFRNTGSVLGYQEYFQQFLTAVKEKNILTFNSFDGKADIKGKQYLVDLWRQGFPVIPTVETISEAHKLGNPKQYVVKLKNGADSIGMEIISSDVLHHVNTEGKIIQPYLNIVYEVSFYYLNNRFQYALYTPDKENRWALKEYEPTNLDLAFADRFINWNNMERGIARVDACRLQDNSLLLVELEDLNPFLSLQLLAKEKQEQFFKNWVDVLKKL